MSARRAAAGLAGAAALIAVITLAARLVGFGRWFVFSATVGSTCVGTAYSSANLLPNVLFEVVAGGALAASVVPLLAGALARGQRAEADATASALLTWTILALVPVSLLLAAAARPLAAALVPGDCPQQVGLTARMLVVFAPQIALYGIGIVLTGVLQAHRRFMGAALAPLLSSVVVILSYLAYGALAHGRQGTGWVPSLRTELVLSVGTTLGVAALSLPLLVPVRRCGIRLRPTLRLAPDALRPARRLIAGGVLTLAAQQVLVVVTLLLTRTSGGTGTINVYQYVQALYLLPYAVLALPLATATFPRLSTHAASGDGSGFATTLALTTRVVVLAASTGAAVLVAVAPALGEVFGGIDASRFGAGSGPASAHAGVGAAALAGLPLALTAFAPGLVGLGLIAHLGRALLALGRVGWASGGTAVGWLCAAALSVPLVSVLARGGDDPQATLLALGVASTVGMSLAGAALLVALSRAVAGAPELTGALHRVGRVLVGALVVGASAAVLGRLVTDAVRSTGPGSLGQALTAGLLGALAAALVLAAGGFAVAGADLRSWWRRSREPAAPQASEVPR